MVAALHGALTVTAALLQRKRTGEGAFIDISHSDAAASCLFDKFFALNFGAEHRDDRYSPDTTRYQYYPTADNRTLTFAFTRPDHYRKFCELVGRPDMVDLKPNTQEEREAIASVARTRTQSEWVEFLIANRLMGAPQHSIDELLDDPHFRARDLLAECPGSSGEMLKVFGTPAKVRGQVFGVTPPPELGRDTDTLLAEFGFTQARVEGLRKGGVVQ
jgi:formyl-CoA transferase